MKYLVVSFILFFCTLQTFGQQEYFVYLQTDNNQAFYIRINNNVFSSTTGGYLILSKLPGSAASVTIGFPKNVFPEQQFNIPVNNKDAGYLVKNFGDKGWGLFNLQTMAVIMNNNPPEEKKSPEITVSKKNDAFSLLLANAVNDTSVLYTVSKPPKPVPPPAIIDEKKTDTAALVIKDLPGKDTVALVKNLPEKKDSILVTKNSTKPAADSNKLAATHLPAAKEVTVPEKNKKPATDTLAIAKKTAPPASNKDSAKSVTAKIKQFFKGRNASKPKKDTIIIADSNTEPATTIAKNKNERRDTIIMMKGNVLEDNKPVVKNTTAQKVSKPPTDRKKDSLQTAKNNKTVKKPGEKTIVPANNPAAIAGRNSIVKKDTLINKTALKKDTVAALVKNNSAARKPKEKINIPANNPPAVAVQNNTDTMAGNAALKKDTAAALAKNETPKPAGTDAVGTAPLKRQRPLVNRAAEFLTDTSYIAVFIDESKDKFDTIRISIPFNEEAAFVKQEKAATKDTKSADTTISKTVKDSLPAVIAEQHTAPVVTKDSVPVITQQATAPVTKQEDAVRTLTDSAKTTKKQGQPQVINDCKDTASDSDIDKLRIKMMLANSDEDRLALAKKVYRLKCFSVKQVRALSELFKSDEGKYQWLDALYPFVSDTGNFSSLAEILKDNYYLNRFRAMLRN